MIVLNNDQSNWIKKNFNLSKRDFPTDFCDIDDFIKILQGKHYYRGKDYKGDNQDFVDDCLLSFYARESNEKQFIRIFTQLHRFWIPESLKLEYYELVENLYEINERFERRRVY